MDFFDREVDGGLDEMFDMNRDGVLDMNEQGLSWNFLKKMIPMMTMTMMTRLMMLLIA